MPSFSSPWSSFAVLLILAAFIACGDGTTTPAGPGDPDPVVAACDWIAISPGSAMPGERVELGVVPDSFGLSTWVEVRVAGDTTTGYTWLERAASGPAAMVTPVHPLGDPDGGVVELTVTDGNLTCEPIDFDIQALPEAPGATRAVVDSLEAMIELQAQLFGITAQALADASPDTLPPERIPLAMVQAVISHPDNPNSLAAIVSGTSEQFGDVDLAMADRLIARSGFAESLGDFLAALRASGAPAALEPAASGGPDLAWSSHTSCSRYLDTPEALDYCMGKAADAGSALNGSTGKLMNDMGSFAAGAGFVPDAPTRAAAAILGAGAWTAQTYFGGVAGIYPSRLGDLTFDLTKTTFKEDEQGSGQWENAEISATSTGWAVGKAALEAMLQLAGVIGPVDDLLSSARVTASLKDGFDYVVGNQVQDFIDTATNGADFIEIPAETFGPVPVDGDRWTEWEVDAFEVIVLTDRTTYEPRRPGTGYVIGQNVQGTFADQTSRTQKPVEVQQIQVHIDPSSQQADAGQVLALDATVTNAANPEALEVTASLGTIINVTYEGAGLHTIEYSAPDQADFHDFITATHTAATGARAYTGEPRVAQADIYSQRQLIVEPFGVCLEANEQQTFTARVVGLDNQEVSWEVVEGPGSVDSGGTYTPDGPGSAVIRATSAADTALSAQATATVGGCDCWFSVDVSGGTTFGSGTLDASHQVTYWISGGRIVSIGLEGTATTGESALLSFTIDGGAPLGPGTAVASATGSYFEGTYPTELATDVAGGQSVDLYLLQADTAGMDGSAIGDVVVSDYPYDDPNTNPGTIQAAFRSVPDNVSLAGSYTCSVSGS